MNPLRYKLMISYLPGMASVVNSFQSPDVQKAVFDSLMEALNVKLEAEAAGSGTIATSRTRTTTSTTKPQALVTTKVIRETSHFTPGDDVAHDLAEGDSIHSMTDREEAVL